MCASSWIRTPTCWPCRVGPIRNDGNVYYVNGVDANGQAQRVDVTTGYTDGDLTEVSGELQPGQQVYISEPVAASAQQPGFNLFGIRIGR